MAVDLFLYLLVFAAVTLGSFIGIQLVLRDLAVRRRLGETPASEPRAEPVMRSNEVGNTFMTWVQARSSLSDTEGRSKLRADLSFIGIEHPAAPVWYVIGRFSAAVGLPLLFLVSTAFMATPPEPFWLIALPGLLCALSLIAPRAVLDNRVRTRREKLEQEFPDVLDLIVVCIEAGLGLEAALVRVAHEVKESHPVMADALERVSQQLRAGQNRADALRKMADRAKVDGVRALVALMIQSDTLGASIAQTLRSYATELRGNRFLAAEEKAMRIPVLMTIPLIACILPVIMTALLLPPMLDVARELLPAMRGAGAR